MRRSRVSSVHGSPGGFPAGEPSLGPPGKSRTVSRWRDGELVAVGIMADAGSDAEAPGEAGLARMTQQMLFQGTARRSALAIAREIEDLGGTVSGSARRESAYFSALVDRSHWPQAMDLLDDLTREPRFDPAALELEKRAILGEIEFRRQPSAARARRLLLSAIWPDRNADAGEEVKRFSIGHVRRFFERAYAPERRVFGAVGPVELERRTGSLAGPRRERGAVWHTASVHEPAPIGRSHICIALPAPMAGEPAFDLLNEVAGGGVYSRLGARTNRPVRTSVAVNGTSAAWVIETTAAPGSEAAAVNGVLSALRAMAGSDPLIDEELWMARESLAARRRQDRENPLKILEGLLETALRGGRPEAGSNIEAVDLARLARTADICITPWLPQVSVVCVGPVSGQSAAADLHHVVDSHRHGMVRLSLNGSH